MRRTLHTLLPFTLFTLVGLLGTSAQAQNAADPEDEYYRLVRFPMTEQVVLEAGALEMLPDGKLAVATRRGEIYLIESPYSEKPEEIFPLPYASGLHEVLGLAYRDGWLYCVQRCEVTRMKDTNGDGRADVFEVVADGWEINGDYHEYAFGSKFDKEGNLWVTLCLTGSFSSEVKYRGWCLRITPDGKVIPTTSGVRSPGGIGANAAGDMFYTDNQGPWNGACASSGCGPAGLSAIPVAIAGTRRPAK